RMAIPSNESLKHAHALLRLRHPNAERRQEAKAELEEIAARNPAVALQIHREFAADALQRNDYDELQRRQALILADPRANFTDQLQKANVDMLVNHQPFEALFPQLALRATGNEGDAVQFVQWLLVQNRAGEAAGWLEQLPVDVRSHPTVKSVEADAIAQLGDWDRLARLLETGAWGPIMPATLRLALAANTIDSPTRPSLRREAWDMTVESAGGNLGSLRVLQRLASLWKWTDEYERTLWIIARGFPDQTWAHQSLFNLYKEKKDARSMREVMGLLRSADAAVPRYQHDWALLSMLIEPNSNWNAAKDTATRLHELYPDNATYATAYAFALAQSGKASEALAVVEKLSDSDRGYLPRQPYLAYIYGVTKKRAEMEKAIALAEGVPYLAEESYLFVRAREELERKPSKPITPDKASGGSSKA
ncbi:MAG TPA: hypothetical protein VEA63_16950, partial [Opitutus sp.]|nr:hypothetical protein [Opitutus sp.]